MRPSTRDRLTYFAIPAAALAMVVFAALMSWQGSSATGDVVAVIGMALLALPLVARTMREAARGNFATDAIASIAIITALVLREPIPGLIIVLMQSGGEALESIAQRRARRALSLLEDSSPRTANRWTDGSYVEIPVASVHVGDRLLVRPGNVVPADGVVVEGRSHLDTATITGEPLPLSAEKGTKVFSGYVNASSPLVIEVSAVPADSQYERIVQLVKTAQQQKAPLQRVADRYAVWFTPLTVAVALLTWWVTRDSIRVLAVLVIATPCPLILAVPVAVIGGINRAARASILFRDGGALEGLGIIRAVIFDKTGTLTTGAPAVSAVSPINGQSESQLLQLVASLELGSSHTLGREIVIHTLGRGIKPSFVAESIESPGRGIAGRVDGSAVAIGSYDFMKEHVRDSSIQKFPPPVGLVSYVAIDGHAAATVSYADSMRPDLPRMLSRLRADGIQHIEILSGDDEGAVGTIAAALDVDGAHGNLKPSDKLAHLARIRGGHGATAMIGDGTNDAPALAAADIGIAVTPRGGGIAAETADVILLGDDLTHIPEAIAISRRTLRIAHQSIYAGLALSGCGMVAAAFGFIPPIPAALIQEAIDVAVIANALRASAG